MTPAEPLIFISYSRKQFYFAENIVVELESDEFSLWFDVQQLTPGIRWETAIEDGLQRCTGVILLASEAALASPYVEKEWVRVQDEGKPVCVCVIEDVELPERLKRPEVMVIDMRRDFEAGLNRLVDHLIGNIVSNDRDTLRIPKRGRTLPRAIRDNVTFWMIVAWFYGLQALIAFLDIFSESTFRLRMISLITCALFAFIGISYWRWGRRIVHRQHNEQERNRVTATFLLSIVTGFGCSIFGVPSFPFFLITVLFLPALTLLRLVPIDSDLTMKSDRFRWAITGEVGAVTRIATLKKFQGVQQQKKSDDGEAYTELLSETVSDALPLSTSDAEKLKTLPPIRYTLIHEPREDYLAERVNDTMQKLGHTPVDRVEDANYQLIFVGFETPVKRLEDAIQHPTPPIFLLSAPINMDSDSPAARYQWIDYRRRSQRQLTTMAQLLQVHQTLTSEDRLNYEQTFVPLNFQSRLLPQVMALLLGIMAFTGIALCAGAGGALALLLHQDLRAGLAMIAMLLMGGWMLIVENRLRSRNLDLANARASTVLAFVPLFMMLAALIVGVISNSADSSGNSSSLFGCLGSLTGSLLITLFASISALKLWLPAPGSVSAGPYLGLALQPTLVRDRVLLALIGSGLVFALMNMIRG